MIKLLATDTADDEKQKTWCEDELYKSAEEKSAAASKLSQEEAQISETTDTKDVVTEEIAALVQEIKDLDQAVAEATEQRKEEHSEYLTSTQLSEAAMQLLGKAKNRLNKFYNPTQYKAAPKTEGTMEEKIIDAGTFAQVRSHTRREDDEDDVAPPEAPETFGEYKKSEKSAGVIGLMDMMAKDLESDMKDAEYEEKTSQDDYAKLMEESQATREANMKSITQKAGTKADMETR